MKIINKETGEIIEASKKAMRINRLRRRVWAWSNFLKEVKSGCSLWMVTLTYKNVDDWKPLHITEFRKAVQKMYGKKLIGYAWVAELQERGAVHYHVMLYLRGVERLPHFDTLGLWEHGLTRIDKARTPFYLISYAKKDYQKMGKFPKGMRMFAVWLSASAVSEKILYQFRLSANPNWVSDIVKNFLDWWEGYVKPKRLQGGGWDIGDMTFKSPYMVKL